MRFQGHHRVLTLDVDLVGKKDPTSEELEDHLEKESNGYNRLHVGKDFGGEGAIREFRRWLAMKEWRVAVEMIEPARRRKGMKIEPKHSKARVKRQKEASQWMKRGKPEKDGAR